MENNKMPFRISLEQTDQKGTEHRWPLFIRGTIALIMGTIILALTEVEKTAPVLMVYIFGIFCEIGGITAGIEAFVSCGRIKRWWPMALEAILSIFIGSIMLRAPAAVTLALPYFIGFWAIPSGLLQILWAQRFSKTYSNLWFFGLSGFTSFVLGILVLAVTNHGPLTIAWSLGCYGVIFGTSLTSMAAYLKAMADNA